MTQTAPKVQLEAVDPKISVALASRFRISALVCLAVIAVLALTNIAGWIFDVAAFKRPIPDQSQLQSAAAICLLFSTLSVLGMDFAHSVEKFQRALTWAARILAVIVIFAGVIDLVDCFSGLDLNVSYALFTPGNGARGLTFPGPMFVDVALNCALCGLALALYNLRIKHQNVSDYVALILAVPNLVIVACFAGGVTGACALFNCIKFSPLVSAAFTLMAYALLFLRPTKSIAALYTYRTKGGVLIRRITLALLILVPSSIFMAITLHAQADRVADAPFDHTIANAILLVFELVVIVLCSLWVARKIDNLEDEKTHVIDLLNSSINSHVGQQRAMKRVCLMCSKEFDDTSLKLCPDDNNELELVATKLKPGFMFAEKYEIIDLLGSGGISTVYLVKHLLLDKQCALKLLHAHFATEAKYIQRFQREAKAMSKLAHPNIAAIHDFGVSLDGTAYLVMDYLKGQSLDELVKANGPMKWQQAVPIFIDICNGLKHAHGESVIHRDLKPANVMLVEHSTKGRIAKIVDFGLAKALDTQSQLTQTGDILGSPAYMSPEQCRGGAVDARADIYSLGALMYDCLVGRPPIMGASVYETLLLHATAPPDPFPEILKVPEWLQQPIFKAMEKDKLKRQQDVAELIDALQSGVTSALTGNETQKT